MTARGDDLYARLHPRPADAARKAADSTSDQERDDRPLRELTGDELYERLHPQPRGDDAA